SSSGTPSAAKRASSSCAAARTITWRTSCTDRWRVTASTAELTACRVAPWSPQPPFSVVIPASRLPWWPVSELVSELVPKLALELAPEPAPPPAPKPVVERVSAPTCADRTRWPGHLALLTKGTLHPVSADRITGSGQRTSGCRGGGRRTPVLGPCDQPAGTR